MVENRKAPVTIRLSSIATVIFALFSLGGCTKDEIVPLEPESVEIEVSVGGFTGSMKVLYEARFDNLRVDITGADWQVVATVRSKTVDGVIILDLPDITADKLCKVARDDYRDYEGFWPAEQVSDRTAKVADLGDITAYMGDVPVGRIYLTDWNGTGNNSGRCNIYFHYADRPFTLSGYNLTRPPKPPMESEDRKSFGYRASFTEGWNAYADITDGSTDQHGNKITLCTTDIPDEAALRWRFENW